MAADNPRLGIGLMVAAMLVFAIQDGISRHLAETYSVFMIVMIRYWVLMAFVLAVSARRQGGISGVARSARPWLQFFRGMLLALEIVVTVSAFVALGLVETHALFSCYPLIAAALSGPILRERVGWRRWLAIVVGLIGVLVILQPGVRVFSPQALIPILGAAMFALYALMTRLASRTDSSATSFFWTGVGGVVTMTVIGPFFWTPMARPDLLWMGTLSITGIVGHYLLIRAYEAAEVGTVQPFAYLQLAFVSVIGVAVFGEVLHANVVLGSAIVVGAALFALWRERRRSKPVTAVAGPR